MGIKSDEVRISIVHSGVGAINESDIMLASASNALIIGFNVRPDAAARKMAEHEKVDMRMYRVIYDAINDVEAAIKGMLEKKYEERLSAVPKSVKSLRRRKSSSAVPMSRKARSPARPRSASSATASSSTKAKSTACAVSKMMSRKSQPATNAALPWKNTATSRKATKSKPTKWSKSNPNKGRYVLWENYEYARYRNLSNRKYRRCS